MKKLFWCIAVVFLAAAAFSYEGVVIGGYDGKFTTSNFKNQCSDSRARELLFKFSRGDEVIDFYKVNRAIMDREDVAVIKDFEQYLIDNYEIKADYSFSHIITRSKTDEYKDGWIFFSHFSSVSSGGWTHNIWYYKIKTGD